MELLQIHRNFANNLPYDKQDLKWGFPPGIEIPVNKKAILSIGANSLALRNEANKYPDHFKMFLFPEYPFFFCGAGDYGHILNIEAAHNLIFSSCPYTGPWREKYFNSPKHIYTHCFLPMNNKYYQNEEKIYDVIYAGNYHVSPIMDYIFKVIRSFNSCIIGANVSGIVSEEHKMKSIGQSKISITHNLLFLDPYIGAVNYIKALPEWNECEAFSHLDLNLLPGAKYRVYEAAISKSLILHKRDPWNMIENWFTPDEDFIYFDDEDDLIDKIHEILNNYDKYKVIVDNAYNKMIRNYTTEQFIKNYIQAQVNE